MNRKKELKRIAEKIKKCKKCDLWKTRKNAVPGEGPANSKIMILGQAPGSKENETGRPFIGRAGQLLSQLLKIAKIKREKVFITSILKCFPTPPSNRKPTKNEIKACLPCLKKQVEIMNPKKFILLGQVAFSAFFPKNKLKDFRGKWFKKDNKEFFISYHPAAGIRFTKMKKILQSDFKKLKKRI